MGPNVGCGAFLTAPARTACQLYVGHEGDHAALVVIALRRQLRRWATGGAAVDIDFTASVAAGLPWSPGHPSLVDPPAAALSVVPATAEPAASSTVRHLHIAS